MTVAYSKKCKLLLTLYEGCQINYPAASGRGIKREITGVLRAASHIVDLDFSHTFQSCLHYRVFRQYLQNNYISPKLTHPMTFFLSEDIV